MSDQANGYVVADAIKMLPQDAAPSTATWTPNLTGAGNYNIYARWTAHPNRATDASYTVTHAGGATVVTINQQQGSGQWQSLGNFNLDVNSKVSLTDQANGYVIADAVQFIPASQPQTNTATWTPNVTGSYQIYAKWTQHPNRATNAAYTVTHANGSSEITVNQQQNGGVWNLLGSFNLDVASNIRLTDQANGYVIADAIKLVASNVAPAVSLTSPANGATAAAPGSFTLTADASDSDGTIARVDFYAGTTLIGTVTEAPYTFAWNNVTVGSYSLTAVATDNYGTSTVSAAISVTVNTGVAQAYYIHTDHLDTPRQITDTAGNVVWQWDNVDPFGANMANENPNGAGQFSFNLRFPGQYFDRGTNTHYNIFRDYDPSIGRYIQSDPIGLDGGIDTYGYANQNPLIFTDPLGLMGGLAPPYRSNNWYGNWCGPGGSGRTIGCVDAACKRHDSCYDKCGLKAGNRWLPPSLWGKCASKCDEELYQDYKNCSRGVCQ